jgi:hypothetical protein
MAQRERLAGVVVDIAACGGRPVDSVPAAEDPGMIAQLITRCRKGRADPA